MTLANLEQQWMALFAQLRAGTFPRIQPDQLAAPFLSTQFAGYEPGRPGTMMLVGKATFNRNTISMGAVEDAYTVEKVKERTSRALAAYREPGEYSAFTAFMADLSNSAAEEFTTEGPVFHNMIWTNLAKIGQLSQNPSGALLAIQEELAIATLLAEIKTYRPKLVIFCTQYYGYGRINRVIEGMTGLPTTMKYGPSSDWQYCVDERSPAILWTAHPQGKSLGWRLSRRDAIRNLLRKANR